ncbi:TIM44-like domain-containing protein [Bacillus sp. FJAT-50079]|uniref:Tim44 domain-containing protein n=1 Tax=Bacillus sp. FJAT-50079 TaxID=2833577 RepID=UPI001BC91174|nr:TIM44-like domain-containing protein [Bacillus sp. FJAT-50079]MBS4207036.1 Tim44 domain-containing protein [Bacillus sp. FJAT-50079]
MNRGKFLLKIMLCALFIFLIQVDFTFADVGNGVSHNEDPSGGGSFDFSGEGIDLWFLFYLLREHPILAVIVIIAFFLVKKFRKPTTTTTRPQNRSRPAYRPVAANLSKLKEKDPLFSDELFLSKVNNMFIQLQQAWMDKQWNSIRPFETDPLFNMHHKQLQSYIDQQRTNVVENIAILDSKIVRYENDGDHDEIDVYLRVRINDYVIDDHTKKVIKGNPNRDIYMTYIWTLIRKGNVVTEEEKEQYEVTQCPNCGANVSINASGQCEYCESVISSGEYNWVLSKIKIVSQE